MRTVLFLALTSTLLLSGCDRSTSTTRQVTVYMYSEYIDPEIPAAFEQLTGTKVKIDVYESSEEMLAKLQQGGGASQYDVIVASDAHIPAMIALGLVRPLDATRIPNKANVAQQFQNPPFDPGCKYSLPYQWGTVGLIYSTSKVQGKDISWAMLFDPAKQPGKFILVDSMRDMVGIALKYQGKSMSTRDPAEVKAAGELLLATKKSPNALGFEGGVGGKNRVVGGEAALAVVYNGDAVKAAAENPGKIAFAVPKEGGVIWTDVMMVSAKAPNPDAAHQFINYILDAKVGAQLSNFNRYPTPNSASLPMIRKEDRENEAIYPTDEMVRKLEYLTDVGKDTRIYDEVWTTVKAR